MRTIRDWYLNADSDGVESSGFDPENDDRPDHHVDRWLDRAVASGTGRHGASADRRPNDPPGRSNRARMPGRPGAVTASRWPDNRKGLSDAFIDAVRHKRADDPALSAGHLAAELERSGWRDVEPWHVHLALFGRLPGQRQTQPAHPNRRAAAHPPVPPAATVRRHRDTGGSRNADSGRNPVSPGRVDGPRTMNGGRHDTVRDARPRKQRNERTSGAGRALLDSAPLEAPIICRACEVRVSPTGRCRCS